MVLTQDAREVLKNTKFVTKKMRQDAFYQIPEMYLEFNRIIWCKSLKLHQEIEKLFPGF